MSEKFFYMHGRATSDLQTFTGSLLGILCGTSSVPWRTPEVQRQYMEFSEAMGKERVSNHIKRRMLGHTMAFLENDFPYNEIMPFGGYEEHSGGGLAHLCLWSNDRDLLIPKHIDTVVNINFPAMPALIFMHDDLNKSVKAIEHAHIVVDVGSGKVKLSKRYFDGRDFIETEF